MAVKKQYASPDAYEAKLARVMERMGVTEYNYNWDRHMAWVEFRRKGQLFRGGEYEQPLSVSVTNFAEGDTVYYTTDGSNPSSSAKTAKLYDGKAIKIGKGLTTLKIMRIDSAAGVRSFLSSTVFL